MSFVTLMKITSSLNFPLVLSFLYNSHLKIRFVGYLEEQAVITYTNILEDLDSGRLPLWKTLPSPAIAIDYWRLPADSMIRDVILSIRADEAHHRLVNHTLGLMNPKDKNPFKPGWEFTKLLKANS